MKVTFCGHRTVENRETVSVWLNETVEKLVQDGADTFYLGGKGTFDTMAAETLFRLRERNKHIRTILVLPYLQDRMGDGAWYDETVYPPIENRPKKYAIVYRNRWMVEQSDCLVAYVTQDWGGAHTTLTYAQRKNKRVIRFGGR